MQNNSFEDDYFKSFISGKMAIDKEDIQSDDLDKYSLQTF